MGVLLKFAAFKEDVPKGVADIMNASLPAIVLLIKDYISTRHEEDKRKLVVENETLKAQAGGS